MAQVCCGPSVAGQLLLETMKSSLALISPISTDVAFWLVMVTLRGALVVPTACDPKARDPGLTTMPSPLATRSTRSGLAGSLLTTVSAPGRAPDKVGVKVMLIVQVPWGGTDEPQLWEAM